MACSYFSIKTMYFACLCYFSYSTVLIAHCVLNQIMDIYFQIKENGASYYTPPDRGRESNIVWVESPKNCCKTLSILFLHFLELLIYFSSRIIDRTYVMICRLPIINIHKLDLFMYKISKYELFGNELCLEILQWRPNNSFHISKTLPSGQNLLD